MKQLCSLHKIILVTSEIIKNQLYHRSSRVLHWSIKVSQGLWVGIQWLRGPFLLDSSSLHLEITAF